jgi:ABC-type polysaccharide/polyol phosphate export permease
MSGSTTEAIASPRRQAQSGPFALVVSGIRDMTQRSRLVRHLVWADMKRTHADTVFGQLWWIFDPLLQMAVYWVLVTIIFSRGVVDYPLFLFAALLPWKWFNTTLNDATISVTARESLIRQIQFPKIVLPTASVLSGTISFGFGLAALGIVYLFFLHRLTPWVLLIPVIAAVQFVFTLAVAVMLSALNAFFRDVQNVFRHLIRLWFYLSPVLYSLDIIAPDHALRPILWLNPFTPLLESYRAVTWGMHEPYWLPLLGVLLLSIIMLGIAIYLFKRVEPAFARIL